MIADDPIALRASAHRKQLMREAELHRLIKKHHADKRSAIGQTETKIGKRRS